MPIASPSEYRAMLDRAHAGGYALPAINVSTVTAINGALAGLSEAESDGILQVLPAAGAFEGGRVGGDGGNGYAWKALWSRNLNRRTRRRL